MDRAVAERCLIYEPYSRAAPVVQPKQMPPIGFDQLPHQNNKRVV